MKHIFQLASEKRISFATLGISADWDVNAGIAHLSAIAHFDEVMIGRSWQNAGVLKYVYQGFPGRPATPQLLIVHRTIGDTTDLSGYAPYMVSNESLLSRKIGLYEIEHWLNQGAPLPSPMQPIQP
jgi:hypothetical protein